MSVTASGDASRALCASRKKCCDSACICVHAHEGSWRMLSSCTSALQCFSPRAAHGQEIGYTLMNGVRTCIGDITRKVAGGVSDLMAFMHYPALPQCISFVDHRPFDAIMNWA